MPVIFTVRNTSEVPVDEKPIDYAWKQECDRFDREIFAERMGKIRSPQLGHVYAGAYDGEEIWL